MRISKSLVVVAMKKPHWTFFDTILAGVFLPVLGILFFAMPWLIPVFFLAGWAASLQVRA
jgi:hypothetical protein